MKTKHLPMLIAAVTFLLLTSFSFTSSTKTNPSMGHSAAAELRTNMRKLWEDHVTWTRNVIFCLADDLPGKDIAVKRLLKNQDDIGNAIKPYYGEEAGKKLTDLLYPHINISAEVVLAAKANN